MMTRPHPALSPDLIERLRESVAPDGRDPSMGPRDNVVGPRSWVLAKARRWVRSAISWYVDEVARDAAVRTTAELAEHLRQSKSDETAVLNINLELLKGEVRGLLHTVEDLGMAIAPATGIEGAPARMAELREGLHALERRLRAVAQSPSAAGPAPTAPAVAEEVTAPRPAPDGGAPVLSGFDYSAFERRFRGDPEAVLADLKARYLELLRPAGPVLDLGCGRGELLAVLAEEGIEGVGVDTDEGMVAEAAERGVTVHHEDAVAYLRSLPEASVGAIVAMQVLEHLPFPVVLELIDLSRSRLRPGGLFVAETPNPASLVVLGNSYILDPTHVRPLHPALLAFLCESAGFRDVRLEFWAPAEGYHLRPVEDPEAPPWVEQVNEAFAQLNRVLFGPQDYAVVATTAPA